MPAVVMVSIKWPHEGSITHALETGDFRTGILAVSADERSDDKET